MSKMISIYDPFRNAFCQVPIEQAKKMIDKDYIKSIDKAVKEAEGDGGQDE